MHERPTPGQYCGYPSGPGSPIPHVSTGLPVGTGGLVGRRLTRYLRARWHVGSSGSATGYRLRTPPGSPRPAPTQHARHQYCAAHAERHVAARRSANARHQYRASLAGTTQARRQIARPTSGPSRFPPTSRCVSVELVPTHGPNLAVAA
eukprot:524212-Rhodomonas_salina.1